MFAYIVLLASAFPAVGYVGPGAGLSVLGALWGLLIAIVAAMFFLIAWPVRRMLRRRRQDAAVVRGGGTESIETDWHPDTVSSTQHAPDAPSAAGGDADAPSTLRSGR
jgi:hypothetical protein